MENNLVNLFVGSNIDANYIASLLIDNDIKCFVQNTLEESMSAGWASGSSDNSSIVRVDISDAEKGKFIINEYLNSQTK